MTDDNKNVNSPELQKTYDTLLKRAIGGDTDALASMKVLVSKAGPVKKYSLSEDIRQSAYEEYLDPKTSPSVKSKIMNFFKKK